MVGELEIIFALDAVSGELRIARQALVLLEQLRRVAALPVVLAVASGLSAEVLPPLSPTTAPAAALSQTGTWLRRSLTLSFRTAP